MLAGLAVAPLTAVVAAAALRPRGWATFAITAYVLLVGEVVAITELLSPARAVTPGWVLVAEIVIAVVVTALVLVQGWRFPARPGLDVPRPLVLMLGVVAVALVYELSLAVFTPPNNYDSMTYHLSRAAAWYQHHRVGYVDSHSARENESAPNAEILMLFSLLFVHGDRLAAIWQWLAQPAAMASIYVIALRLGVSRAAAVFAALLFATMAQPALQASSTQNDLVAASLVGCSIAALCTRERWRYAIAALALGLAVGTKLTVVLALPAVGLLALKLTPRRDRPRFAAAAVAAFAAVGAYGYVLNVIHTGSAQGTGPAVAFWAPHSWLDRAATVFAVPVSLIVQVDPTSQDAAYFGPLGAAAIVPVVVLALRRAVRSRTLTLEAALALALPTFVLALAYTYKFNSWIGRFLLVPVVLVAPLVALLFERRRYIVTVALLGVFALFLSLTLDTVKPAGLFGRPSIWTMTRPQALALSRPAMLPALLRFESIPSHARIGYSIAEDDWDYPLYGRDLTRTPVRLPAGAQLATADRRGLRWLVVQDGDPRSRPRDGWTRERLGKSGLDLLRRIGGD